MKTSPTGIKLVKQFEDYLQPLPDGGCEAYQEPGDVPTIGWGCTRGVTLGLKWTRDQAEAALAAELALHEKRVNELVDVPLDQGQFDALVSFDYNTGGLTLEGGGPSTLLKKLNEGDYDGASAEFPKWNKMGGKVLNGLTTRRAKERSMFDGDYAKPMPQTVDPPKTPTAKDLQQTSTKFHLATIWQWIFGGTGFAGVGLMAGPELGQSVGAIGTAAKVYHDYGAIGLIVGACVFVILLDVFKARTLEDAKEGRYTPSGETKK